MARQKGEKPRAGDPTFLHRVNARNEHGEAICGGMKRNGEPCTRSGRTLYPNGRCAKHGGPASMKADALKDGQSSRVLDRIREESIALQRHHDVLLDTLPLIARMHTICEHLEKRYQAGDPPEFRTRALELHRASFDEENGHAARHELGKLLEEGVAIDRAVESWSVNLERLLKRIEATIHLRQSRERQLSADDVRRMLSLMMAVVLRQAGDDPDLLRLLILFDNAANYVMGPSHVLTLDAAQAKVVAKGT